MNSTAEFQEEARGHYLDQVRSARFQHHGWCQPWFEAPEQWSTLLTDWAAAMFEPELPLLPGGERPVVTRRSPCVDPRHRGTRTDRHIPCPKAQDS